MHGWMGGKLAKEGGKLAKKGGKLKKKGGQNVRKVVRMLERWV